MVGNRNGFFYVLDRVTGELLLGTPFTATSWARELDADGRPIVLNDGSQGCVPDPWGSTNFMPPTFVPEQDLFILTARETCATYVPEKPTDARGSQILVEPYSSMQNRGAELCGRWTSTRVILSGNSAIRRPHLAVCSALLPVLCLQATMRGISWLLVRMMAIISGTIRQVLEFGVLRR